VSVSDAQGESRTKKTRNDGPLGNTRHLFLIHRRKGHNQICERKKEKPTRRGRGGAVALPGPLRSEEEGGETHEGGASIVSIAGVLLKEAGKDRMPGNLGQGKRGNPLSNSTSHEFRQERSDIRFREKSTSRKERKWEHYGEWENLELGVGKPSSRRGRIRDGEWRGWETGRRRGPEKNGVWKTAQRTLNKYEDRTVKLGKKKGVEDANPAITDYRRATRVESQRKEGEMSSDR